MQSRQMAARLPNLGARLTLLSTLRSGVEALNVHSGLTLCQYYTQFEEPPKILGFLYTLFESTLSKDKSVPT